MEEYVGKLWHRFITRRASHVHEAAVVPLEEMRLSVGIMFRALGGDGGLRVDAASATEHRARRNWLQHIAGSGQQVELAWRDEESLHLPARIALFAERGLNRDLYLWLAAMAASDDPHTTQPWLARNQSLARRTLERFPGLERRYRRLVEAQLALRPALEQLSDDEAAQERSIQQALREPGTVDALPPARHPPQPVYLWLHPSPPGSGPAVTLADDGADEDEEHEGQSKELEDQRRRRAERVEMPEGKDGLLSLRMENIFTWAEYVKVDRSTDEEKDEQAEQAADDMEVLSVARDNRSIASRLRFDLDMPAAEYDDLPLGGEITLPEWDFRKQWLRPDHCRLQPMVARHSEAQPLPQPLRRTARRIRGQFEALSQSRVWYRGQADGSEVDLDAYLDFVTEKRLGHVSQEQGLYRDFRSGNRDLACLLLADLSLSTDAAVNDDERVIDVIRNSLFLFAEALHTVGDRFAMYGFSSRRREHVRFHTLKDFDDRYGDEVRGRIQAIKPGYYTRMGAAIRHATRLLAGQPANQQLLMLLTDGKPNDLDLYEGRYGVEDTRMALLEARQQGLHPFCVTIDKQAGDYLPHLFGPDGFVVIRKPSELPQQLPLLYARLTA